ncbi:MAG: hypothetical protein A2849_03890 [Candidatus Taylorbacteria bacterium RIFCSPHIGHO2_01_FULL_51_15]|uniref:Uncharacterized protein n=1 Tax=Candidatus Taylorbacteria bacterium RIFCSPHIGHO2_01_FULL_51_15 TaxID=1802304 RepID=A0A1G2MCC1_9BACT|nr:MAG: hypothetical protein A2849_03890 [Candidatus Taylorbacteria bacterium RIFCSPHIGHO2_01_FULL_51_15]
MKEFVAQFKALLDAGKLEEAKALLSTLGSLPETAEERAEAKLFMTDLYVRLTNAANQAYLDILHDSIAKLKVLAAKDRDIDEAAKLAKARASLAE